MELKEKLKNIFMSSDGNERDMIARLEELYNTLEGNQKHVVGNLVAYIDWAAENNVNLHEDINASCAGHEISSLLHVGLIPEDYGLAGALILRSSLHAWLIAKELQKDIPEFNN